MLYHYNFSHGSQTWKDTFHDPVHSVWWIHHPSKLPCEEIKLQGYRLLWEIPVPPVTSEGVLTADVLVVGQLQYPISKAAFLGYFWYHLSPRRCPSFPRRQILSVGSLLGTTLEIHTFEGVKEAGLGRGEHWIVIKLKQNPRLIRWGRLELRWLFGIIQNWRNRTETLFPWRALFSQVQVPEKDAAKSSQLPSLLQLQQQISQGWGGGAGEQNIHCTHSLQS